MNREDLYQAVDHIVGLVNALPNRSQMDAETVEIIRELDELRSRLMEEGVRGINPSH